MSEEDISNDNNQEPIEVETGKTKSLTIRHLELPIYQDFVKTAKSQRLQYHYLFQQAFTFYQNFFVSLDASELATMLEARTQAPQTLAKRIKKIALHYAQEIIAAKDKPPKAINIKAKNSAVSAKARADALIQEILAHNEQAVHWYDKILLTKSSILEYAKKKKQQDNEAISIGHLVLDRCLERHQEQINAHHKQHELNPKHNSRAYYERLKTNKENNND